MATASAPRQNLQPSFYRHPQPEKIGPPHALAPGRRHLLHGVGRHLWHGRHRARRRLRQGHSHPAADPDSLEPADRLHDRRTFQRAALRRRLLRLGAPRHGQLLGISGSLAVAGGLDFRHGDLSHPVCALSRPPVSLVCGRASRRDGGSGGGDRLRAAEYCRRASGLDDFAVAVLRAVGAVHPDRGDRAVQVWSAGQCRDHADDFDS